MNWIILIISLPTENTAIRMRVWRAVKTSGAGVLRDGVYLLPERESCRANFDNIATDVQSGGGTAYLMRIESANGDNFTDLFDRHEAYSALLTELGKSSNALTATGNAQNTAKLLRKLRKTFAAIAAIDFFPGEAQKQIAAALLELETRVNRILAPDEPHAVNTAVVKLNIDDYQAKTWATRQRPWVDRLASAWLIRRFIDPDARFVWLTSIADCPTDALGFDFDGATFSHSGSRVTFEVLLESFSLDDPNLKRLGALVHYLDVGGIQTPEAAGVEMILAGLLNTIANDEQLLTSASTVFDSLLASFEKGVTCA